VLGTETKVPQQHLGYLEDLELSEMKFCVTFLKANHYLLWYFVWVPYFPPPTKTQIRTDGHETSSGQCGGTHHLGNPETNVVCC